MIICICNNVNDSQINDIIQNCRDGITLDDIKSHIKICDECYCCENEITQLLNKSLMHT